MPSSTTNNTNLSLNLNDIDLKRNVISCSPDNLESDSSRLSHESSFENCIANLSPSSSKSSSSSCYSNSSKSSNILAVENNSLTQVLETENRKEICEKSFSQSSSMNSCSSSVSDRSDVGIVLSSSEATSSTSPSQPVLIPSNLHTLSFTPSNDSTQNKQLESSIIDKKKQTFSFGKKLKQFLSFNATNSKRKCDFNGNVKK
jgi:hypothetical protein